MSNNLQQRQKTLHKMKFFEYEKTWRMSVLNLRRLSRTTTTNRHYQHQQRQQHSRSSLSSSLFTVVGRRCSLFTVVVVVVVVHRRCHRSTAIDHQPTLPTPPTPPTLEVVVVVVVVHRRRSSLSFVVVHRRRSSLSFVFRCSPSLLSMINDQCCQRSIHSFGAKSILYRLWMDGWHPTDHSPAASHSLARPFKVSE